MPDDAIERAREVKRMREAAMGWRLPQYRQVEGPNDLKIYGGTIADDIDRWADMIEAPCGWDRNAVARVIDPSAFPDVGCTILSDELGKLADDLGIGSPATRAFAKTDAIRSLLAFASQQEPGMVLVPREPTPEMLNAASANRVAWERIKGNWSAMLDAAPSVTLGEVG